MHAKNLVKIHYTLLFFSIWIFVHFQASAQEIVIDPNQTGANDVVEFDPITGLTFPLSNPVENPLNLGDNRLWVGNTGDGQLLVDEGASVSTVGTIVGVASQGNGVLAISGDGSQLNTSDLTVGDLGDGVVAISDGAVVDSEVLVIATKSSVGQVHLSGPSSILFARSGITMGGVFTGGSNGSAELLVSAGATLFTDLSIEIRDAAFGSASLVVEGAGSRLDGGGSEHRGETNRLI